MIREDLLGYEAVLRSASAITELQRGISPNDDSVCKYEGVPTRTLNLQN